MYILVVDDLRLVVKNLENRIIALESSTKGSKPQVSHLIKKIDVGFLLLERTGLQSTFI